MKKIIFLFFVLSATTISYSQKSKLANTLLWRISGNGLSKPSYLFGTIHLTDKRVFNFGDSLYRALEQTDAFAAELDMNKVGTQMINQMISEKEEKTAREPVKVKDVVSKELWEKYMAQLAAKFHKPADKVTLDDLDEMKSALEAEVLRKGEMPTFLDGYLFGIARKKGKWVGGIEDIGDQLEHINADDIESKIQTALFDDSYYREGIEWMIKIYTGQLLDSINTMYNQETGEKDYIMIKRNQKMAYRMDSLSAIRSTFFAVGAAHLPGDSGVIALLRNKGFIVSPVHSTKKISADKYIVKGDESAWIPVPVRDSVYALQMPGLAENFGMLEHMGLEMKTFFDVSFMKMYMTFNMELSEDRKKLGADSLYNGVKKQYTQKGQLIKEKRITVNGIEGREYILSIEEGEMKLQVFIAGLDQVILNGVFAVNEKSLHDSETGRFFESFVYNPNYKKSAQPIQNWSVMDYPENAFSVEVPAKPKEAKDVISEEGKIIHTYQAFDYRSLAFYGIRISSVKEGLYDPGIDSNYFFTIKERIRTQFEDSEMLDSSFFTMNNYLGYKLTASGKMDGDQLQTKILTLTRGNRNYYLYTVYQPGDSNQLSADRFLNSFKLLPYQYPEWKTVTSSDGSFSTFSPMALKKVEVGEDEINQWSERFMIYDSVASASLYFDKSIIPSWFWFSSDTAFLRKQAEQYKGSNDSIAGYKITNDGKSKIVDFLVLIPENHLVKKIRLVLRGNELYEIYTHISPNDITGTYDKLFNRFKIEKASNTNVAVQSKMEELPALMKNASLTDIKQIGYWWDELEFSEADIPALQKMLLTVYPDFDTVYGGSTINSRIYNKLLELDSHYTTISYIKDNYSSIQTENEYIKPFVISYLSGISTKESYSLLKNILLNHTLKIQGPVYFKNGFYDSLSLTATLFPEIMKYGETEALGYYIADLASRLANEDLISKESIRQYAKGFVAFARKQLAAKKEDIEENGYDYYDLINVLGIINSTEANALLNKFLQFDNRGIRYTAAIALLENNQPVASKIIYTLASTDEYRHQLYDELKRIKKINLFPLQFLSQKELGKSKVYWYASDDYTPGLITHLGSKTILYKGKQQKFYLYSVPFATEDGGNYYYLGVAGPYSLNAANYSSAHDITGVYWEEELDPKKKDILFKEYLSALEDVEEEEVLDSTEALPESSFTSIKVMSYNIHHANPPSRPGLIDLDTIVGVINKVRPDIVAVQEVDVNTRRSGSALNEADELAKKTGMKVYFAKAIDHDGGDYGIAILSRFPFIAGTTHRLPRIEGSEAESRVLATIQVQLPNNKKFVFACTHFDAERSDSNRIVQAREVVRILRKEINPVILAGDMNAVAGTEVMNILDQYFTRTCIKDCGFTIPVDKPAKTIDFIAYSTSHSFKVISHKVVDEKYASDHLPVVAELQLK